MILVNGYWEQIYDLQDISKIIRENYNRDLADELDRLIPQYTDDDYLELNDKYEKVKIGYMIWKLKITIWQIG